MDDEETNNIIFSLAKGVSRQMKRAGELNISFHPASRADTSIQVYPDPL
jgi:hypothetical protein